MPTNEVFIAFDADNHLGETPVWSEPDSSLWWVNCENPPSLHRWTPADDMHQEWPMPMRIGGFVHKRTGGLLVALADGLYDFDPAKGRLTLRVRSPFPPHVKLHECQCDRQGRFWIGAYDHHFPSDVNAKGGAICRLDDDQLTPVIPGIAVANGLAFSPDGTTMYVSDSPTRRIDAYDLDPTSGEIGNRRDFITLQDGEGYVDGATVDQAGGYWLANVAAGRLLRYLPDGSLDRVVDLPFSNPTKPAFGGPMLDTLYVTSTKSLTQCFCDPSIVNGPLFALSPGETGILDTQLAE